MIPTEASIITKPGFYRMPPAIYHADPMPEPSLSSGVARTLIDMSPLHAWAKHPRLNPAGGTDSASRNMDVGSVAHRLALGKGAEIRVINAKDYRTNAAKAERDEARESGLIPCLLSDYEQAEALCPALREAAENYLGFAIKDCHCEIVIAWQQGRFWRRAMVDVMSPDLLRVVDLKTTAASASPAACIKRIYDMGYHMQSVFYGQGLDTLDPANIGRRRFAFVTAENDEPYAVSPPIELTEGGMTLARSQVETACAVWDACLAAGNWPGYGVDTVQAEPPSWSIRSWEDRLMGDNSLNPVAAS